MTDPDLEQELPFKPPLLKSFLRWAGKWLLIVLAVAIVAAICLAFAALDVALTKAKANFEW